MSCDQAALQSDNDVDGERTWRYLLNVLRHEVNNSLTPIELIAHHMETVLGMPDGDRPPGWEDDLARGLAVIARRSKALGRFTASFADLERLPPPRRAPVRVETWLRRVVELERRLPVLVRPGPDVTICADGDQLDQLLINLVKNAVDAALETGGTVDVSWRCLSRHLEVMVCDEGLGVAQPRSLFVPFFTTKTAGSGIGLALSRQIAEGHRGSLHLEPRSDHQGTQARLRLPMD